MRNVMKNRLFLFVILPFLLTSCIQRQAIMTVESFSDVPIGSSIKQVEDAFGEPYAIHSKGDGSSTFEYMEKVIAGREVLVQKSYFFIVSKDKIVGKYMKYLNPPAYQSIYTDDIYPNY